MATALDALLAALKVKWDASPSLAGINGPYRKRKPPNLSVGFPYVIIEDDPSHLKGYTCQLQYWEHSIDFVIHHRTEELCGANAALVDAIFDSDALTLAISGGTLVKHRKVDEAYEEEDKAVQSVRLTYEFETTKAR